MNEKIVKYGEKVRGKVPDNDRFLIFAVKFLEVIKPFCGILPEIAKPERKVRTTFWGYLHLFSIISRDETMITFYCLFLSATCLFSFLHSYRFNSVKRCYGRQLLYSSFWCVAKFRYSVS